MSKASIVFNQALIRLVKGMIKAWETWLKEKELQNN